MQLPCTPAAECTDTPLLQHSTNPICMQALHVAAMRGHTAAVELLLAAGVPAKIRSSRGWTALDEACAARAMAAARWGRGPD